MRNISKTDNRRAKRMKLWDSGFYSAYMEGTFDARFLQFGLLLSQFPPIHPNFIHFIHTFYPPYRYNAILILYTDV